jgi:hypothetical protein
MTGVGKHTGPPVEPRPLPSRRLLVLAVGVTLTVVAWGFLVWAAIDFGSQARGGEKLAWAFLALATIGATACLFLALILLTRLIRTITSGGQEEAESRPVVPGGRRAAR